MTTPNTQFPLLTIPNFQSLAGIIQPGNSGGDGGSSSRPHGTYKRTVTSATACVITCHPAKQEGWPADNFYYYWKTAVPSLPPTGGLLHYEFNLPTAEDIKACQAVEAEGKEFDGSYCYGGGLQADITDTKHWRVFDYTARKWLNTGVPVAVTPGVPVVCELLFDIDQTAKTVTYRRLSYNGVNTALSMVTKAPANTNAPWALASVQQDCKPAGNPYSTIFGGQNPQGCYMVWL